MDIAKLDKEMTKTKTRMMRNKQTVFFSTLVMSLRTVWDDSQPTAYTNGRVVGWNPDFFLLLDRDERIFVQTHEVCHIVWKHLLRLPGKIASIWQAATDFAINITLKEAGFKVPDESKIKIYLDDRFSGMTANQIYDILIKEGWQPPPGKYMDDLREPEEPKADHEQHVKELLVRAVTATKMSGGAGTIPGNVLILLDELLNPQLPWDTILYRWLNARKRTGYDYTKPNKRFFPEFFLPTRSGKGLDHIVVFMDVSCSVEDFQFKIMASELGGILKRFKPRVTLITFNTVITGIHHIKSYADLLRVQFKGRGGTDCEEMFKWLEENKPDAAICFTDGEFYWHRDTLSVPLVWIINDNPDFHPRFGKAVYYNTR